MEIKYELQNKINSLYPVVVILLVIGWGYRELGNRADKSELAKHQAELTTALGQARLAESEANKRADELKKQLGLVTNTANTIGSGINQAIDLSTGSASLTSQLRKCISGIPEGCECGIR